ncbi:SRPBCC family protein [Halapricum sp. CBA1109]|uniref:SRPBCC family protein n=1 Tax=Halapricum sp. CBA1109 TaxID=2668068 RepID=UPI0012F75214|nr:SRPBCC family protein [Halapricum sp. CBA1109]MUV89554.1 SRPBCC family protein [Halapricum sp. CBA1109]
MLDVSGTIHVDRPVADVFAFMDEPENQAVITPSLTDVSTVGQLDNGGKRATYTYSMVGVSLTGEVAATTYDPDERIVFEMSGDLSGTIEWTFEAADGGTRVGYLATYEVPVPVGKAAVEPLVRKYNERQLRSTLQNLKTTLEAEN